MSKTTEYRNQFTRENYARLTVLVPKGSKQAIEEHIASRGYKSTSEYFKSILARDMGVTDLSELVGGGAKMMKKIKNRLLQLREKMREHQLLSFIVVGLILFVLYELLERVAFFIFIFGLPFIAVFLRRESVIEEEKAKMDYLAKKIAEENANKKDPQ